MVHEGESRVGMLARGVLAAGALLVVASAGPAQAQTAEMDARWLPWLGCWQPVEQEATGAAQTVCVVPAAQGTGVQLVTYAGGAEVARELLSADGAPRAVEHGGCAGHESAAWSSDNKRVHLSSELACEGGNMRRATGLIAMASPTEWLDIQAISADAGATRRGVRVVRYRAVSAEQARMLGGAVPADRTLAVETARHAAAVPVTFEQVLESVARLDNEAVEAWLIERRARFPLSASRLIQLDDAGVPASVIDLMVALSNPQRFAIDHASRTSERVQPERSTLSGDELAMRRYGYGRYGSSWFDYGYDRYGYDRYGYNYGRSGYGYGSPYRFGSYYGGYMPIIVVVNPGGEEEAAGRPRVVRDRGFTRSADGGSGAVRAPQPQQSSGGSTSSGSSSSAGASSSGGATSSPPARTAQPRQGTGGGGQEQQQ
jgi:hypothetical protein